MMRPFLQFYETVNISLIILITDCAPGNSLCIIDYHDFRVVLPELRERAFGSAIRNLSGSIFLFLFVQVLTSQIRICPFHFNRLIKKH